MAISREESQARLDRRGPAVAMHAPKGTFTIADRLEGWALSRPQHAFLLAGDVSLSYCQVNAGANQLARAVQRLGLKKGDVCALAMENRPEFFVVFFALAKLGVEVALINTNITGRILAHSLQTTGAKAAVVGEECLPNFDSDETRELLPLWLSPDAGKPAGEELKRLCSAELASLAQAEDDANLPADTRAGIVAENNALFMFTSGTTGLPKAARCSHMRWMMAGDTMRISLDADEQDVFYCFLPLYHGAALMSLGSTALASGAAIAMRRKFSTTDFWNDVRRYGATVGQYIGEICRYLLSQPERPDDREHTLRRMMGAGLSAEVWKRFQQRFGIEQIIEGWGSTEANCGITNLDNVPGACGRVPAWDKTNFRLVRYDVETDTHPRDANGHLIACEVGETGEAIGMILNLAEIGAGRFEGYTSKEATEKKILRNVFRDGDAWWSSGDLLRYDEDGYVYFIDRVGDTFRWKSENVSTQEVAESLGDYPGLEILNVYGVKVPGHEGRGGMATLVMQEGHGFDPAGFYALCDQRLPRYAMPLFVRVSGQADLTSTFKLRKVDLQRESYDPGNFTDPLYVRDDAQGTYAPFSAEVLARVGLPPANADADPAAAPANPQEKEA